MNDAIKRLNDAIKKLNDAIKKGKNKIGLNIILMQLKLSFFSSASISIIYPFFHQLAYPLYFLFILVRVKVIYFLSLTGNEFSI